MTQLFFSSRVRLDRIAERRSKAVWGRAATTWTAAFFMFTLAASAAAQGNDDKFDNELKARAAVGAGWRRTRVIVQTDGSELPPSLRQYQQKSLKMIGAVVLDVPDSVLPQVAALPTVRSAHFDRPIWAADFLSTRTTLADVEWQNFGFTGKNVGVAVIDSGITTWHDDLTQNLNTNPRSSRGGNQRVSRFVDFVNGQRQPYDDHGHGSHVAGIILGNGYDSLGRHSGMAPDADLIALKVLDRDGKGTISDIIAALEWVADHQRSDNIRVVNLSAGAAVTESYWTDPLTLATKSLVDRGIVVVAAAGNLGRNAAGQKQYGGILSPGNAPWVLTIGASSAEGTTDRGDDTLAGFSSLGPTRGDYLAKPDLVAPGYGIRSLSVPGSALFAANSQYLIGGSISTAYPPYLSLSGTSMAAPQVAGTIALMFEANPNLTPNLVKAILQYTAESKPLYHPLEQGAGFLDTLGAVSLAGFYKRNVPGSTMPVQPSWSQHVMWGNHMVTGGSINPLANAWDLSTVWGAVRATRGDDNIVWGTRGDDNIVWGTRGDDNIVWGTLCGGANCPFVVWGARGDDNIVWGTADGDNILWP